MNNSLKRAAILILLMHLFAPATCDARITFENETSRTISVWLMPQGRSTYNGPYHIYAHTEIDVAVIPGIYFVTALRNGEWEQLGWRDYTDNKITYTLKHCAPCTPSGGTPVFVAQTHVYHREAAYVCPRCGRVHTRWAPGWSATDEGSVSGEFDEHGAFHAAFAPEGPYRLGASVIDGGYGALVAATDRGSPATQLSRADGGDTTTYSLTPGINLITHVNGDRVRNSSEFAEAIARSGSDVELRVYNTTLRRTRDYHTVLRSLTY